MSRLIERYAKALFELAKKASVTKVVLDNLQAFVTLIEKHPLLERTLMSPQTSLRDAESVIVELSQKMRVEALTLNFLKTLVFYRRLPWLSSIVDRFSALVQESQHILDVNVVSAEALSKDTRVALEDILTQKLQKKIAMHHKIDASLLGGFKLQVGNYSIDLSMKAHLLQLKTQLQG